MSTGRENDDRDQKIIHREIERKRRQEMATLYASLRSELPLECIRGKRSTADQMAAAVNYIKNLQNNVKELDHKRDQLKKSSSSSDSSSDPGKGGSSSHSMNRVTVFPCLGGVKIEVISSMYQETLKLSKLMQILLEEGLNVVTCDSTQVNDKFLHTIQCEVIDPNCVNFVELQQMLNNVVNGS
ncbi:transcription factor bHLH118-like [Diospyros lotus]|uniref:transcription factor bHLH118-like n=1 Tax=Diospyros lotus TaxID=55363 RepID=UPI0022558160|nr:transcription factor bHLH118-like [Diospyros lotus]